MKKVSQTSQKHTEGAVLTQPDPQERKLQIHRQQLRTLPTPVRGLPDTPLQWHCAPPQSPCSKVPGLRCSESPKAGDGSDLNSPSVPRPPERLEICDRDAACSTSRREAYEGRDQRVCEGI